MEPTTTPSPYSYVRAAKAIRPTQEEIQRAIQIANRNYSTSAGRAFEASIYTK